ncbi:MAG TPA: polysaccharide deacetylase family protein [Candidatus Paceibacterota bacterium]|nr:polysaccharide deacetylase family protein [Candidatus Paceibacterota bacterium]
MAYTDFSFKKVLPLSLFMIVLSAAIVTTFAWKADAFGSTPFFRAVRLFAEETAVYGIFAIRHYDHQLAAAAASVGGPDTAAASVPTASLAQAIPVLTYHRLGVFGSDNQNVSLQNFMDQMETLSANGWHTITLEQYEAFMKGKIALPAKSFLLTFDDGAQQSVYPVDPILKTLGFTAVEYIIVAASEEQGSTYYLSQAQIAHMLASGRWEIGSHSYDGHREYPTGPNGETGVFFADKLWLPDQDRLETSDEFAQRVTRDLTEAKQDLESTYGVTVNTFAFPFGGESGINAAGNFPQGESTSEQIASQIYDIGWLQTARKDFTYNYPAYAGFLQYRIHVDHDWDGQRLLAELENGLPKVLPYTDSMQENRGWMDSWGTVQAGGVLALSATSSQTSASSILDGSRLWKDYEFDATVSWHTGYAFLLADATNARTYRDCTFADGVVEIQDTTNASITTLKKRFDSSIKSGDDIPLGIRVSGDTISCLYDGNVVLTYEGLASRQGGIGVQAWNPQPGTAGLTVTHVAVSAL